MKSHHYHVKFVEFSMVYFLPRPFYLFLKFHNVELYLDGVTAAGGEAPGPSR